MAINRAQASNAFTSYVAAYDPTNPRIALKVAHTWRVAALAERIAQAEALDADLAWLCGLLHDVGRFEQVRRFDTFNDAASVSHAALGAEVLFADGGAAPNTGAPLIRSFVENDEADELIHTVVATHSDYRLPADLDERTRAYAHVLRDADKIDIIKVNCICPIEDIYGVSEASMRASALSPAVVSAFYEHRTIPRNIRVFPADILVSHICFAWELVYPSSRALLAEQGYLDRMLSRRFGDPRTQQTFEAMATHMRAKLPQ